MRIDPARLPYPAILGLVLSIALFTVGGCGQSGPLYLPEPKQAEQPPLRSADLDTDKKKPADTAGETGGTPSADQAVEPSPTTGE